MSAQLSGILCRQRGWWNDGASCGSWPLRRHFSSTPCAAPGPFSTDVTPREARLPWVQNGLFRAEIALPGTAWRASVNFAQRGVAALSLGSQGKGAPSLERGRTPDGWGARQGLPKNTKLPLDPSSLQHRPTWFEAASNLVTTPTEPLPSLVARKLAESCSPLAPAGCPSCEVAHQLLNGCSGPISTTSGRSGLCWGQSWPQSCQIQPRLADLGPSVWPIFADIWPNSAN